MDLHALLVELAQAEGFPLASTVDLELATRADQPAHLKENQTFAAHVQKYDEWIQAGNAGSMEYLVRGRDRRADPRLLFPQAQSILCVAIPYPKTPGGSETSSSGPRYARYLQGPDYHETIAAKLEKVMTAAKLRWEYPAQNSDEEQTQHSLEWKICVDSSAVLERSWAALAGLGWIGKNTLLIHPQHGSYLFLGEVLINQRTFRGPAPLPNYCGNCTRCLKACPTQALVEPGRLDSRQCVSYLTLEKRGELPISDQTKSKIGTWIAGCDICQEVCPFNRKAVLAAQQSPEIIPEDSATQLKTWMDLLQETPEAYRKRVKNSALNRIKPPQFRRNLAINLYNYLTGRLLGASNLLHDALPQAPSLDNLSAPNSLTSNELSVLFSLIQHRAETEDDTVARAEWDRCLSLFRTV